MSERPRPGAGTLSVWAGEEARQDGGATQIPVVHSVSFGYRDMDRWEAVGRGAEQGHIYTRNSNPTVAVFQEKVRRLEGAESASAFASGMAAISNIFFALLRSGSRVVSVRDLYGGTSKLFMEFLPRFQIQAVQLDTDQIDQVAAAVADGCDLLYLESPTNPLLKVLDIARLAQTAARAGAVTVVDNTLATPINQRPLALGADLVVHSATKFLGGHADALGGVVCGRRELVERIDHFREINGASLDPTAAYLILRGMKTLHLRVERQNENALAVARFLAGHSAVTAVHYPGLENHPHYDIARRQMRGFGGLLSFSLAGGLPAVQSFLPRLRHAHLAANLGPVETVAGPPATTSHVECTPQERRALGIPEGLVRYSAGVEDVDDLLADLEQALASLAP